MMTPAERGEIARLAARLAALEQRVVSVAGPGVSSRNGPVQVRTTQLGFPAELTAAWDDDHGYAWKRLRLEGVDSENPAVQPAGTGAVTPDGDTSLAADVRGWMEPSPDAQGFYFLTSAAPADADTDCRARLAGLRTRECLVLLILPLGDTDWSGAAETAAASSAEFGGWAADETVVTGDGDTTLVFFRKAEGGIGIKAVGETQTWFGDYLGCVADGYAEYAVPYCPPDPLDAGGSGGGESEECAALTNCGDHTFRVRAKCGPCEVTRTPACTPPVPPFTVPRTLQFSATYIGGGTGYDYVGTLTYRGPLFEVDCYGAGSVVLSDLWYGVIPNPDPATAGTFPTVAINLRVENSQIKAWFGDGEYCGFPSAVGFACGAVGAYSAPYFTASPFKFDVSNATHHYVVE